MLVEDTTAFVEQVEVPRDDRRARARRRRLAHAEMDVLRADWERRLAADALRNMEDELASLADALDAGAGRRLLRARTRRTLERRVSSMRRRMQAMESEALLARERLRELQGSAVRDRPPPGAKVFRLHSARHHLDCSDRRFADFASAQADVPVLVRKREGRSWWWFLDRFWWDDDGLKPREVKVIVLDADLRRKQQAEATARARAELLGEERPPSLSREPVSQVVRFAVWCRDRGRCVDCGTAEDVGFDEILPPGRGGSRSTLNVELRCLICRERRGFNQERARVSRARVAATAPVL